MPFIVRVLEEDIARWEEYQHEVNISSQYLQDRARTGRHFYHLRQEIYHTELAGISLKAPARLESLVDQDLLLQINIEEGYLSQRTGSKPRVLLLLKRLTRPLEGKPRRLRLRIEKVELQPDGPPRVILKEIESGDATDSPKMGEIK